MRQQGAEEQERQRAETQLVMVTESGKATVVRYKLVGGIAVVHHGRVRLRHVATGVSVDLRVGGESTPRPGQPPYPPPGAVGGSRDDLRCGATRSKNGNGSGAAEGGIGRDEPAAMMRRSPSPQPLLDSDLGDEAQLQPVAS